MILNQKRESSSSDDQDDHIDTSDELIDMDMDLNDKFIADCEAEANRRKRSLPNEETEETE